MKCKTGRCGTNRDAISKVKQAFTTKRQMLVPRPNPMKPDEQLLRKTSKEPANSK